jgi:hypothetical protein
MKKVTQTQLKLAKLAATLTFALFYQNANATLTSFSNGGKDLVYSSVSDVTWTKDGNLMSTLMRPYTREQWATLLSKASGNSDVQYTDFTTTGLTNWRGATAFINYLNSINYAGISSWRLPSQSNTTFGYVAASNGSNIGDELSELYYNELGSKGLFDVNGKFQPNLNGINDANNYFVNEKTESYWTGTSYAGNTLGAWIFSTKYGSQETQNKAVFYNYAWAISSGKVSAVPLPATVWLFAAGLTVVMGFVRYRRDRPQN